MNPSLTIARREIASYFFSPNGYLVFALFTLFTTAFFFLFNFQPGAEATMRTTFTGVSWLLILLAPAISMRLLSEEYNSGAIEVLMTSPITDAQVVIGKWLGAMGFLVLLLLPLLVFVGILEQYGEPDLGPIITGWIGLLLIGGMYLAIGAFASSLTKNQLIAFVLGLVLVCLFSFVLLLVQVAINAFDLTGRTPPAVMETMFFLNAVEQFQDFNKGLIDVSNIVYFVSGTGLFLFAAVKMLESKRWR